MVDRKHLEILRQGVDVWNEWRAKNSGITIDLNSAHLIEADLSHANLIKAECFDANLRGAKLTGANLFGATLIGSDLAGTDLTEANLSNAFLNGADLRGANVRKAKLIGTTFLKTMLADTIFGNSDLSQIVGLERVIHRGPSPITMDTLALSKGKIPEAFLRGCGLSDADIEYAKLYNSDLSNEEINKILYRLYDLRANQALQVSPLFISYSHIDSLFVDKLEAQLGRKGIRFWRDSHDLKAGRIETQIDQAINQNRTVLLILSEQSLKSDWVEHEVRRARGLEKETGRDLLCPVALDDSWKDSHWPKRVMEQIMEYNILDFSEWDDDVKFDGMFRKLIDGLELFYKDKSHGE